jgi:hypothetical protein
MKYGYARVRIVNQDLQTQIQALKKKVVMLSILRSSQERKQIDRNLPRSFYAGNRRYVG